MFELYNILNVRDFQRLKDDVAAGRLSKQEFVARMAEVEWRAGDKTRAFYIRVFLPWAKEHRLSTYPQLWLIGRHADPPKSFDLWLAAENQPYRRHYEQAYDWIVLNSLTKNHQSEKAIKLAAAMLERAVPIEEKARLYEFRGTAYAHEQEYEMAIADYTEAVRLDSRLAGAYYGRGLAYTKKGETAKADEDFVQAKKLGYKAK